MTRYEVFRRRIAPVAFIVAIGLLVRESCNKGDHADATFVFDYGSAAALVQAIDVDVYVGSDMLSHFHREAIAGGTIGKTQFTGSLPDHDGELRIDVDLPTQKRHIVRPFHADNHATVTIPLERDLQ